VPGCGERCLDFRGPHRGDADSVGCHAERDDFELRQVTPDLFVGDPVGE
jgi:hypothetical protein